MPEDDRLSYTVTPGPEVLAKMGTSWTLFASPPVTFTVGPNGEPPKPATVTMTAEQAADLAASGYVVEEALPSPEPANDVQVSPGREGLLPELADDVRVVPEGEAAPADVGTGSVGTAESMPGGPGEGVQAEPGAQADGSPAEPIRRRKT